MTGDQIRENYLDFFRARGHTIIKSASLIPENDPSTLFTSSGMQPLVPYLLGEKHPGGRRLADSQKSFRSADIEEVGDSRHTTCFEMLGNWSLGDYFKREQLNWIWEFFTQTLKLEPERLYVSVFRGNKELGIERDKTSVDIWQDIFRRAGIEAKDADNAENKGMREARIFYYDEAKNWWSRSGEPANMPVGEIGGPDSEVFYDLGGDLGRHEKSPWKDRPCHINCDCGRFIEIGNSVFIEFIKTESGFSRLKQKNVDFGGGLERLAMIKQNKSNIFETDFYINSIGELEKLSGLKYGDNCRAFEIIADHLKAAVFIMGDDKGVAPSNVDQGYIVRRLVRRAVRFGRQINITSLGWTKGIAAIIINDYKHVYDELERNRNFVLREMEKEENKFSRTIDRGLKEFEKIKWQASGNSRVKDGRGPAKADPALAFKLFQTYGFPPEMINEELSKKSLYVSEEDFKREARKHQALSRTASAGKFKGGLADASDNTKKLHTAAHLLLAALREALGRHVAQKGSNITGERLRFDFSHSRKMTEEEKARVEQLVNRAIEDNMKVDCEEMTLEEAKNNGAAGVFESKYGEKVKVYTIGSKTKPFSREICGGPHVKNTGQLGKFKIKKEQSSSAGVRRIKAVLE